MFLLKLIIIGLTVQLCLSADETLVSGSMGAGVVEATVSKIESACIFPDDKLFTRRLAYVESYDGADPKTYRSGYYGGIWQVDKVMFDLTQSSTASSYLNLYLQNINKSFGIVWSQVKWEDLTKPLYSALASRLYISYESRYETGGIPRAINDQANFWVKYYRPGSNPNDFVTKANTLENTCISNGADIIFLFDSSGSIGSSNFDKMKTFAKDVVNSFEVGFGSSQNRFGLIQFASSVYTEFNLNTYSTAKDINLAIDRAKYYAGSTYTYLGLDEMRNNGFSERNGARPISEYHPRIGIVLTDGISSNPSRTNQSAAATQAAGISLIAVGIGSNANMGELSAIASDPDCLNMILLSFADLDSLHYIIEKRTCDAPVDIKPGDNSTIELPPGGDQNCKINITKEGVTVELIALNEATTSFYVSRSSFPSENYYDEKVVASAGHMGLMFIQNLKNGSLESIFCNIKAGNISSNISIGCKPGDGDVCKNTKPCLNGGACENQPGSSYICHCTPEYTGHNCEIEVNPCNDKPCLNGASCQNTHDSSYTCHCPSYYTGQHCETEVDPCNDKPCLNGATCQNTHDGSYTCHCPSSFTGQDCQTEIVGTYNCEDRNPCTTENLENEHLFFPNDDPNKYVQCSYWGQCYIMSCPPNTVWKQEILSCDWPAKK